MAVSSMGSKVGGEEHSPQRLCHPMQPGLVLQATQSTVASEKGRGLAVGSGSGDRILGGEETQKGRGEGPD
jgi:hypothetical protein